MSPYCPANGARFDDAGSGHDLSRLTRFRRGERARISSGLAAAARRNARGIGRCPRRAAGKTVLMRGARGNAAAILRRFARAAMDALCAGLETMEYKFEVKNVGDCLSY